MNVEGLRDYCLSLPYVSEHLPFDEVTLVFKIAEAKLFAIISLDNPDSVNLKCDPEKAIELRESFMSVQPGYHMSKKHWNTVFFNGDIADDALKELIRHSYDLVYAGLPKKIKLQFPL